MTIPNRTVSITGIFAADASTTIPLNPVPGASYRDTTMTGTVVREGWAFKTIVDSSKFNQAMYEYSSVTAQIEKYGFLPWSNLTDYVEGSVCLGSNGMLYQAKQATGPSTTAVDPTTDSTVWQQILLGNTNSLFDHKWSDYQFNRMDWLRADTFSWQDGTVYTNAYNHLVDDVDGKTASNSDTIGSYTVYYVLADDGHKIVGPDQEATVNNIYNESGVAWYYILDKANQRFKLPRENPAREELIQVVRAKGNGNGLGLTNGTISGSYAWVPYNYSSPGVLESQYPSVGTNGSTTSLERGAIGVVTDSANSGIISSMTDSTSVYKGKQYLYFYVGQFSQTATEQTAGLNSELFNGKMDLDLGNATSITKETIVGWGMPNYSAGVAPGNGSYTAPSNGWYITEVNQVSGGASTTFSVDGVVVDGVSVDYNNKHRFITPLAKGQTITNSNNPRLTRAVFFPCIGG